MKKLWICMFLVGCGGVESVSADAAVDWPVLSEASALPNMGGGGSSGGGGKCQYAECNDNSRLKAANPAAPADVAQ